jgi:very-short-patch-repair endonuclease
MYVAKLRRAATEAEKEVCCYLAWRGAACRFQQTFCHPFYRVADFFIPSLNLNLEIDGAYHEPEDDRRKDAGPCPGEANAAAHG